MPNKTTFREGCDQRRGESLAPEDEPAAYQLVGGVKAHQGEDG